MYEAFLQIYFALHYNFSSNQHPEHRVYVCTHVAGRHVNNRQTVKHHVTVLKYENVILSPHLYQVFTPKKYP